VLSAVLLFGGQRAYAGEIAGGFVTDTEGNRCGSLRWSLDDNGVFTVTGSGPGATYRPAGRDEDDVLCPWNNYRGSIRYVQFNCVFTGAALYHFEYGASINSWFVNCVNLEGYSDIPYGVTDMSAAFLNCTALKQCGSIPDSVVTMMYAFSDCKSIVNPPVISAGLRDDCFEKYHDQNIMQASSALGMTFAGCESLTATPDFTRCTRIKEMLGTFTDCTSLVTVQKIPQNVTDFYDTFRNCVSVRGVFSCEAPSVSFIGATFGNFAQNNDYILFVKVKDAAVYERMCEDAGEGFRGYLWDDLFTVHFHTNGGNDLASRQVVMEYGVQYDNDIRAVFKEQINGSYYDDLPVVLGELPVPVKEGLTFEGWYTDSELTKPFDAGSLVNPSTPVLKQKNIMLYARWEDHQCPKIHVSYLDRDWSRVPVTVRFEVSDNINGGLQRVVLRRREGYRTEDYYVFPVEEGSLTEEFSYTFGDVETKLFEGITYWQVEARDLSGNKCVQEIVIRLDYTPPVILTDSAYDKGKELIYDDRLSVLVSGEDQLSGMGILRINPSDLQNTFLNMEVTPYRTSEFAISYEYYGKEGRRGYVLYAEDKAGNVATRVIVTRKLLASHIKRVIPRENYD
ncbi:MAG: InlB B-repeat-containing protein, partial [Alistipes sp.]|nr:InlB B-repeat-containing protein [Alistipes sp.]